MHLAKILALALLTPIQALADESTNITTVSSLAALMSPTKATEKPPWKKEADTEKKTETKSSSKESTVSSQPSNVWALFRSDMYAAHEYERSMNKTEEEKTSSILSSGVLDMGSLGVWKIRHGEIDSADDEHIASARDMRPLKPDFDPEVAFTDNLTLSRKGGVRYYLDTRQTLSVGIKSKDDGALFLIKKRF
ncbi:MAG: hypothetical protein A3D56_04140 [Candidatus Taylorbacteria bacterium RIFCSPHIGHO2_02_FULL_45_35]|uniref:Uncharacterized protein n=1 Tax=Candidatus Taylorbacteria bacterium RIFCSPHIGHO2_02_FULL_45_35 TaxID=1802311 RepID=A0A1G2MT63_9BACT|nr:MAG: hypothetical protein A3D56_04140 [Candidatus Taylorbacteria bacterium RIFCSPHIGHO2_02_FULL_45_35]